MNSLAHVAPTATEVMTMKNLKARYSVNGAKLTITTRNGKKGINVAATLRVPGQKATTGSRSTHESEADATAAFNLLCETAVAKGWSVKTKTAKSANAFDEIPDASAIAPPPPATDAKDETPAPAPKKNVKK